jgi:hypothetical protein
MSAPFRISKPGAGVRGVSAAAGENFKQYLDRLMKLIPGEIVALYLMGNGIIPGEKVEDKALGLAAWTVICLIGVIAVKAYGTADPQQGQTPDWVHVGISAVAFLIWVYTIGGPFEAYGLAKPWVGSLLVLAWTFFTPLFYKGS